MCVANITSTLLLPHTSPKKFALQTEQSSTECSQRRSTNKAKINIQEHVLISPKRLIRGKVSHPNTTAFLHTVTVIYQLFTLSIPSSYCKLTVESDSLTAEGMHGMQWRSKKEDLPTQQPFVSLFELNFSKL